MLSGSFGIHISPSLATLPHHLTSFGRLLVRKYPAVHLFFSFQRSLLFFPFFSLFAFPCFFRLSPLCCGLWPIFLFSLPPCPISIFLGISSSFFPFPLPPPSFLSGESNRHSASISLPRMPHLPFDYECCEGSIALRSPLHLTIFPGVHYREVSCSLRQFRGDSSHENAVKQSARW